MKYFNIECTKSLTDYIFIKDMKTYFIRNNNLKIYIFIFAYVYKNTCISTAYSKYVLQKETGFLYI